MLAQKRIQNAIFVVLALLFGGNFSAPAFAVETSATVIDFYNLSQDKEWDWLSQGLADMLITDLSSVDHFQIVDREGLQKYLDELELQGSGLIDHQSLISVGLLAGVEKVIFGTYQVDGNAKINVQATIVDIVSQRAEKAVRVSGEVSEVLDLEKELVASLIVEFGVSLSDQEMKNLQFKWTESLDATAHFYTALDHYDHGDLPLALAEAKVAERIDPDYVPARFWTGRLFIELAEYGHADLYLTKFLEDASERHYQQAYVVHVALLLTQLYEKFLETPENAIPVLEALKRDKLDSFERANIHFQLANIYRQTNQYEKAYRLFLSLYTQTEDSNLTQKFRIPYHSIIFLPSIRRLRSMSLENYQSTYLLVYYDTDTPPAPRPEMVLLTEDNPSFSRTEVYQGQFSNGYSDYVTPKPLFYAPNGKRFRAFTFEFRGKQKEISIHPQVYLSQQFDHTGEKGNMPEPKSGVSTIRYEAHQEMVQAFKFLAYVKDQPEGKFSWSVTAEFMPVDAVQPGSTEFWHDLLANNIQYPLLIDTPGHIGEKTTLLEDDEGQFWIIYDTRDKNAKNDRSDDSDFWLIHSPDKTTWEGPQRMVALNSVANDFDPVLIQDGRKRLVVAFVSDRGGQNELWLALSRAGKTWQRPRRMIIRDRAGNELDNLITPALFQDHKGFYRLAAFHTEQQKVLVSSSTDLVHWEEARFVALPDMQPEHGWGDNVTLDYFEDNSGNYRLIVSPNYLFDHKIYLGTSENSTDWKIGKADFPADSHPSVIHASDGQYALMMSSGVDSGISDYHLFYPFQMTSKNWDTWDKPVPLPRIHYVVDFHMKPSEIYQDKSGFYWIANHMHYGEQFQLYRLDVFPAKTIAEAFPPMKNANRYARYQLMREELLLEARQAGEKDLASCLRFAMHYETCFDKTADNVNTDGQ